ncbi:MAG: ABC transporter ATP-binding protein [Clostridia bacterium]|nr:ABC transporter ATP-binding protein [Clostridia bacterium]
MIEVKNLSKNFGDKKAIDDISFSIGKGEIVGLLGPNGAGKSTTMNIITGCISATMGKVTISSKDMLKYPEEAKKCIGYLPEVPPLYPDMTVLEYLGFVFDLKKAKGKKSEIIKEISDTVKISDVSGRLIKNLSKGYKQRVGLAQALIGDPEILILDEPNAGLDPKQVIEFRNIIKNLGKDRTVIFSSHILSEVSEVCDKIIIINNGKIVAEGKTDKLSEALETENGYTVRVRGDKSRVTGLLGSIYGAYDVRAGGTDEADVYDYEVKASRDIREDIFYTMAKENCPVLELRQKKFSLEETYIKITNSNTDREFTV